MHIAPTAPRLLLVEDHDHLRTLFQHVLQQQGYAVQTVAALPQAQPLLASQRFQLILIELSPVTDRQSYGVLETVQEQAEQTPILLLSRWDEATELARQREFRHILEHPFALEALEAAIEACRFAPR